MKTTVTIDQSLHGYLRGHRELASSIDLDPAGADLMLSLSDLLVTVGSDEQDSYLTAYPVPSAQRFVLARTWLAGPELRPGSVWTHSLILDFPALALIDDLAILLDHFRKPPSQDHSMYALPIEIDGTSKSDLRCSELSVMDRASTGLCQLYSPDAANSISLPATGPVDDIVAVALWRQMWPAFRRRFAFVTGISRRSIQFDADCTLQFVHEALVTSSDNNQDFQDGYAALLDDLMETGPTPLRSFIGRYAIESAFPRELVAPLADLYQMDREVSLAERLMRISSLREEADLPRLVRDTILNELVNEPAEDDLVTLIEGYRDHPAPGNLEAALAPLVEREDINLVRVMKASQPSMSGELGDLIFTTIARDAAEDTLVGAAQAGIERLELLEYRPELWNNPEFWPVDDDDRARLVENSEQSLKLADALKLFSSGIGSKVAATVMRDTAASIPNMLTLLGRVTGPAISQVANWIVASDKFVERLAKSPVKLQPREINILCDAVIAGGEGKNLSPYWSDVISAQADGASQLSLSALIVGYCAALAVEPSRSIPLATMTFDRLYGAIRGYDHNRDQEGFLTACLPNWRYSLRHSLMLSIVEKWHASSINVRAIGISCNDDVLKDIVEQLVAKHGRSKFEALLTSKRLSPTILARFRKIYRPKPPKKKTSSWFWFDW